MHCRADSMPAVAWPISPAARFQRAFLPGAGRVFWPSDPKERWQGRPRVKALGGFLCA